MEELVCFYKLYFFSIGGTRPPALAWFLAGLAAGGNRGKLKMSYPRWGPCCDRGDRSS